MKTPCLSVIAVAVIVLVSAGCRTQSSARINAEYSPRSGANAPDSTNPSTRYTREIDRLSAELKRCNVELNRWKRATVTVYGFDDARFNTTPGDHGVWVFAGCGEGDIIHIPDLAAAKSSKGKHGIDQWSSIRVSVTLPTE